MNAVGKCEEEILVTKICEFHRQISSLPSLWPSQQVNALFTALVNTCTPYSHIDVSKLQPDHQKIRSKLISLCARAESLLESHYSKLLSTFQNPIHHLSIFPYFSNYILLSSLESNLISQHQHPKNLSKLAFIGSGPLPLTSIILALNHFPNATFHNYDLDPSANSMASRLVEPDLELSSRMSFITADIMGVREALGDYDVVFLAALVGLDREDKCRAVMHLSEHMAPGAMLVVRSAHGARGFLYPIVEMEDLHGFEILSVFHPSDEVVNSVIIARKVCEEHDHRQLQQHWVIGNGKCCVEIQGFGNNGGCKMEELVVDD